MQEILKILNRYKLRINKGIALKAILGSAVLFGGGIQLWLIFWQILGAFSPALLYLNLGLRAALVLAIIYVIWQGYKNFWTPLKMARYLDELHGADDDLFQNTLELEAAGAPAEINQALQESASSRLKENNYTLPRTLSSRVFFAIVFFWLGLLSYWTLSAADFRQAFNQFYTNRPPEVIYKKEIEISPGNTRVGKHSEVLVRVLRPDLRLNHRLFYRHQEAWRELALSDNSYLFRHLDSSIEYYIQNEVAKSEIFKIEVLEEPLVRKWHLLYQYPAYTRLPTHADSLSYGDIEAYAGSVVNLSIMSNIPVIRASLIFEDNSQKDMIQSAPDQFSTQLNITKNQSWYLELEDELGRISRPVEKQIRILPDHPPQIRILFPGQDVNLNQDLLLPLIISADDDFGLANASLHYEINGKEEQSFTIQSVITSKMFNTDYLWDLGNLGLFPGDYVSYWAEIYDNAPKPQKGVSQRFRARLPSIEEIYREIEERENEKKSELASSLEESQKLQERFEEKRRELLKDPALKWEDKQELQSILENQEELVQQVENVAESYQDLINKMQANSTLSSETLEKMMKIQELMQEIATDELIEAMQKLQDAMENVSAEALKKALEDFKFSMEDFAQKIEQTLQLLESIKNEQAIQKALQISEELEKMQKALQDKTTDMNQDAAKLAEDQAQIKDKYDTLLEELEKLAEMLQNDPDLAAQMQELIQDMKESGTKQDMQQSMHALQQNQRAESSQAQDDIMEKMRRFTLRLAEMKDSMSSGAGAAIVQAVELAIRELLILSKQHEASAARYEDNPYVILPELISTNEGLQISINKLFSQPQVSMVLPQKFFADLTDTNKGYRNIFGVLGQSRIPSIRLPLQNIQKGINLMVYDLMQALENASSGGGGGGMDSMMQMLEQMGQEQMAMNMLTEQLMMQMQAQGGGMDAAMQEQMGKLAADQERLAENLRRALATNPDAQKQGSALKNIIEEAEQVSRALKQNQLSPDLLKRQENILSRLLDARLSINKRDTSERRKAEQASGLPEGERKTGIDYENLRRATLLEDGFKSYPHEYQELIMEYLRLIQEGQTP